MIYLLMLLSCVTPDCSDPDTTESTPAVVFGVYPEISGCYVVYYDKTTGEVSFELGSIENEGSNFCLTD